MAGKNNEMKVLGPGVAGDFDAAFARLKMNSLNKIGSSVNMHVPVWRLLV